MWRLTAGAYGLADSSRLWYLTSDIALINVFRLTLSKFEPTLYFRSCSTQVLDLILVNNYTYCSWVYAMASFEAFLQKEFEVGEYDQRTILALGCEIDHISDGSIIVT